MYRHDSVISVSAQKLVSGSGIILGKSTTGKPVSMDPDWLARHLVILGKTGTGKSNILVQIIRNIVSNENGSAIVFDPHGHLGRQVGAMFPENSIVVSPKAQTFNGEDFAMQFNAISDGNSQTSAELSAGWVKDAFTNEGVFSQGTWGPRLEVVFTSILREIIISREDATLGDLLDLLTDTGKMRRFISGLQDQQLKAFLKMQIADWRGWNQYVSSSINKLLPLLTNSGIKNLISSRRDSTDLSGILETPGKIVIPEIWRDAVPEETYKIITVLILLKVWLGRFGGGERSPVYIVFDEAQLIPPGILNRLLREGRKFGLRIIMATQFLGSEMHGLSETLRGNVSNIISFSLFEKDAETISYNFFSGNLARKLAATLKSQAVHRSVLWCQGTDGISGPLTFSPHLQDHTLDEGLFDRIRNASVLKYGSRLETSYQPPENTDLHEFLITEFQKFLQIKSIGSDRNVSVDGIYPDLFFTHEASTYYVEVEVSDLANFQRILRKLQDYSGKPLVFITPPGYSMHLFDKILEKLSEMDKLGEKNSDPLGKVSILEYDHGFQFLASGRLRQLRMDYLRYGSYSKSLEELRHAEIRNFIYSRFIKQGVFRMQFPSDEVEKTFGAHNAKKAWNYLCGGSKFISVRDLFRVKGSDTKLQ